MTKHKKIETQSELNEHTRMKHVKLNVVKAKTMKMKMKKSICRNQRLGKLKKKIGLTMNLVLLSKRRFLQREILLIWLLT